MSFGDSWGDVGSCAAGGSFKGDEIVFVATGSNDVTMPLAGLTAGATAAATAAVTAAVPRQIEADIQIGACVQADAQASNCQAAAIATLSATVGAAAAGKHWWTRRQGGHVAGNAKGMAAFRPMRFGLDDRAAWGLAYHRAGSRPVQIPRNKSMNFGQAISSCLSNYATFSGRASRSEFWWFFLFQLLVMIAVSMISEKLPGLVNLALLLPSLAVGARRLHDIGKSGWWQLLMISGIGFLVLLYWWVQPTSDDVGSYGSTPA